MNPLGQKFPRCLSAGVLAGAFLVSSEMPLLASPQSSQTTVTTSPSTQRSDDSLPDALQAQAPQASSSQQSTPSGAAGAKAADVKGAPVAQPVGAAVAPARQRGHRSLLIKLGLLAGGAIAIGSVVALSERSSSRPPGASAAAVHFKVSE